MDFYERLENLRKAKGISQKDLETELEFSNGSISKWKKSIPTHKRLMKLAKYFGVSDEYLLTGKEHSSEFTPEQATLDLLLSQDMELKEALKLYATLSNEKKKHIIETIKMMSEGK